MIAEIKNEQLFVDGQVKHCPYQPVIPYQENAALGVKSGFIRQPCGQWCALFRVNYKDNNPVSVGLWCCQIRYELNRAQ